MQIKHKLAVAVPLVGIMASLTGCETIDPSVVGNVLPHVSLPSINTSHGSISGEDIKVLIYQATVYQQNVARERAQQALKNESFRKTVATKKAKYVAVPVKPTSDQKTTSKNLVMVVDAETGEPKGKAYEPKQASYKMNEEVEVGGNRAVVAQSFAGI